MCRRVGHSDRHVALSTKPWVARLRPGEGNRFMSKKSGNIKGKHAAGGNGSSGSKSTSASKLSTPAKVVIIVFAVLMAFAMMFPSLASIVASNNQEQSDSSQADNSTTDSSSGDSTDSTDSTDDASMDGIPENLQSTAQTYVSEVNSLESKLNDDPNNLAALINVADDYMNWGYASLQASTTDDEKSYSNGLLQKAMDYYDRYLALHDSNTAKVDRALCQYYMGDTAGGTAALEQIAADAPDFGPVWANLGMVYEQAGETDKAMDAYQKAVDADPDNEYGARSYANQRLAILKAEQSESSDSSTTGSDSTDSSTSSTDSNSTSSTDGTTSTSGSSSLADALNSSSGTGL